MPELPEVEVFTRNLATWTRGRRVSRVELVDPRLLAGGDPHGLEALVGREVASVWRRAKWSVLELAPPGPPLALLFHYRMTGKPVLDEVSGPKRKVRLRLHLEGAGEVVPPLVVAFDDSRCLGEVHLLDVSTLPAFFEGLGPDAWPERHPGSFWALRLGSTRRPVKAALLDQALVAGVGNIGASEACFRAGVDPRTPAARLTAAQWDALAAGVWEWVEQTLAEELGPEIHFVTAGGSNPFLVYGREGLPCPRCARPVERMVQAGRSTFWCPACQADNEGLVP